MIAANDANYLLDVASIRRHLQTNVTSLLEARDHLAMQIAALDAVERQVRILALRESSLSPVEQSDCCRTSPPQRASNGDELELPVDA